MLNEQKPVEAPIEANVEAPVQGESESANASAAGESQVEPTQTDREPNAVEGLFDGMTAGQLHESNKSLQGEFTKNQQALKDAEGQLGLLSQYGEPQEVADYLQTLLGDPQFHEYVKGRSEANMLGVQPEDVDDESRKAMDVVERMATNIADQRIKAVMEKEVTPYIDQYKGKLLEANFTTMDNKYEGWRDMQEDMKELAKNLPDGVQDNPSFQDIEGLYMVALNRSGKMNEYAKGIYEKSLTEAKNKSTNKPSPGSAGAGGQAPAKTFAEAAARAQSQLGLSDTDLGG